MLHAIAHCLNDEHSYRQRRKVLLELKVTVHREEHLELGSSEPKKSSILHACPSSALNSGHLVFNQQCRETVRKILIKQDAHLG